MVFKNQQQKALTFSFDDGNLEDVRLVEMLNKYGLKATFNLNSGSLTTSDGWLYKGIKTVRHINYMDHPHLYDGHEVAVHSYRHPHLENCDDNTVYNEIKMDQMLLSYLYGYPMRGMALPFGTYNERTRQIVLDCGIRYCRTIQATYGFDLPQDVILHPTCHFRDPKIYALADAFFAAEDDEAKLFYIWGHSYELVEEADWEAFEAFCRYVAGKSGVWYCTNIEAVDAIEV